MNLSFVAPHTGISGGVKVIFSFAQHLAKEHKHNVIILAKKIGSLDWLLHLGKFEFKLVECPEINHYTIPDSTDVLFNFCDNDPFFPIGEKTKHVLFLQGFGSQQPVLERLSMQYKYDAVFATSAWLASLSKRCGQENIFVTPPGVDSNFSPKSIDPKRLVVGGLYHAAKEKGLELFIASLAKLRKKHDVLPMLLCAKTPTSDDIELMDALLGEYSLVVNPPYKILPYIYSQCTVWFSPSKNEGFGLTTLEAMACGVPVVWNRSYGLDAYLAHGKNCAIVHDKETAGAALSNILSDANKRKELSAAGVKTAARFSWKATSKNFDKAIKALF